MSVTFFVEKISDCSTIILMKRTGGAGTKGKAKAQKKMPASRRRGPEKNKVSAKKKWRDLPFYLSKMSIEYFLKVYYSERNNRTGHLSKQQIGRLKKEYATSSVVLVGGLGGFLFSPDIEYNLLKIIGREVWAIGKGKQDGIVRDLSGIMRCGSCEYNLHRWTDEVAIVLKRLHSVITSSAVLRESEKVIIIGHSSGGLINYSLGLLKTEGVELFLARHRKHFPGVNRISRDKLETVRDFLMKSKLVAINTPFRGICQRLFGLGSKFIPTHVLEAVDEAYLNSLMRETGKLPLDVIDLATHSTMSHSGKFKPSHIMSHALGSGLRFLSRIQQRGPNDGFVPLESAFLRSDIPHREKDLHLGTRDHRDVIEHPEVIYLILKRLAKIDRERRNQQNDVLIGESWTAQDLANDEFILENAEQNVPVQAGPNLTEIDEPQATIQQLVTAEMHLSTNT